MNEQWPGQVVNNDNNWPGKAEEASWPGQQEEQPTTQPTITGFGSALSSLYGLPSLAKSWEETRSVLRTIPPSLVQGYSGLKGAMLEEAILGTQAEGGTPDPESVAELNTLQSVSKLAQQDIEAEMRGASLGKQVGGSALQSLAVNAPGFATSILTRNAAPGIAGATVQTYGQSHAEAIAKHPEASFEARENAALGKAFAEGMFERASLGYLLDRLGKDTLGKLAVKYIGAENATEIPTTIAQNLVDWAEFNPEKSFSDWAKETRHDVLVTALATPLSAGPMGAAAGLVNKAKQEQKIAVQERALAKMLTELAGGVPEAEQLVGNVIDSIRTQQFDPEIAQLQRIQMQGRMAGVPNTEVGTLAAAGLDEILRSPEFDQGGITTDVTERRESPKYSDFATADNTVPSADHVIVAHSQPELVGLRMGQTPEFADGSVSVVGGNVLAMDTLFPGMLPQALADTVQKIARLAGINAPIVVNLTQPSGTTMSWYQQIDLGNGRQAHVITPRELPSFRHQQGNQNTLIDFAYSLTHEIGHALKMEQFTQGITRAAAQANIGLETIVPLVGQIHQQIKQGQIAPELLTSLQQFAPTEAALLAEWQRMRNAVMNDQISAVEFADQWVGPRKLALGFMKTTSIQSIYSWLEREYQKNSKDNRSLQAISAKELVTALGDPLTLLNFDEFMAEQFSRAAHDRNYLQGTTIGQWFQNALAKLRTFFAGLKAEGIVKPTVQFNDWLDQTIARQPTKRGKTWGKVKLSKELKTAQKAQLAQLQAEQLALQEEGEQELSEQEYSLPEDEDVSFEDSREQALEMLKDLVDDKVISADSAEYKRAMKLIEKGQTAKIVDLMFDSRIAGKPLFDADSQYTTKAISRLPDKEVFKQETIKALMQQQDLKKNDVVALKEILDAYPEGNIPRQVVVEAILEKNVPLTLLVTDEYADYGVTNIGLRLNITWESEGSSPRNFTHIWRAPFDLSKDNHFEIPNYTAHTRVYIGPRNYSVYELQSDLFQKNKPPSEQQLERARVEAINAKAYHDRAVGLVDDLSALMAGTSVMQPPAAAASRGFAIPKGTLPEQMAWAQRLVQRYRDGWDVKEVELRILEGRARGEVTPKMAKVINVMGKQTWWQRILREEIAEAARQGKDDFEFAGPDLIAAIEGWARKVNLIEGKEDYDPYYSGRYVDTIENIEYYGTGNLKVINGLMQVEVARQTKTGGQEDHRWLPYADALTHEREVASGFGTWGDFLHKDHQGIYDRYAKEIIPWLQKEYGATEDDLHWWSFKVPEAAKKVILWDKDNAANPTYPQITAATLAGLSNEQLRDPKMVEQAIELWHSLGVESPFFKRWYGDSVLRDAVTGNPIMVWHGSGGVKEFFDMTLSRFEKAFFFSRDFDNAHSYAFGRSTKNSWRYKNIADARKAQRIRQRMETLKEIKDGGLNSRDDYVRVNVLMKQLENQLHEFEAAADKVKGGPTVRPYFLRLENPLVIDFEGDEWKRGAYDEFINTAKQAGHDGLIINNVRDPILDTVYLVFDENQIKDLHNIGTFDKSGDVFWDKTNGEQSTIARMVNQLGVLSPDVIKHSFAAAWHRTQDALVQLQQRAIKPLVNGEVDLPMQMMLRSLQLGEAYKNTLMQPGEVLSKELEGRSQSDLDKIFKYLQAEWKGNESWFTLQGWTAPPTVPGAIQIWGDMEDGGRDVSMAAGMQVKYWTYVPTEQALTQLNAVGIDTTQPHGQEVLQLILQLKQTMMDQFTSLEKDFREKIVNRAGASMLAAKDLSDLYQVMQKIRLSPFMPQGHFGNYALIYQTAKENPRKGERKMKTVRIEYFETRGEWNAALRRAKKLEARSGGKMKVVPRREEEYAGIPLQLPRNLLTNLEATGAFTSDQLQVMSEMMVPVGIEKVATRYLGTWSGGVEGGSEDLLRVYSNYIWHNANFIWKNKFRHDFAKAISAQKALVRRAGKGRSEIAMKLMDELDRNTQIMTRVQEYVLHPPQEYHGIRLVATLVFLAYNIKTAVMNLSTMLNTYAALTTEFGEVSGHKFFALGAIDAGRLAMMKKDPMTRHVNEEGLSPADNELAWMYNRAISEGLIDQSYAYFLAGQANATSNLLQVRQSLVGKLGRNAMDLGMLPFRTIEKANRLATMTAFFEAERARGVDLEEAYLNATKKMELTQGAYDAGNRAEAFRGRRALFTMFYTYMQMMLWHTTGGYARGMKAELARRQKDALEMGNPKLAEKLAVQHLAGAHAYTAKLLLIYLLLGGLTGLPGADNLKDLIVYLWRKIYNTNPELELRQFIKSVGGGGNWYNDPDLVMNGLLHSVAGMDLSGSFSLGRLIPGTSIINRDWKTPEAWIGAFATQAAGPFGGFTSSILKAIQAMDSASYSAHPLLAGTKQMPGAIGAVGKAVDAAILQSRRPTYGVLGKTGERIVEDPPGSGKFRDLTNWELIGMALGGNPAVLSANREKIFFESSEQIYWRTRTQGLLDARNKAIVLGDGGRIEKANADIRKFNDSLEGPYKSIRITGKQMADSLRQHRKSIQDKEADRVPKKLRGVEAEVRQGF